MQRFLDYESVTGATGFLGSHLVSMLVDQGWQVIALGRNKTIGLSIENEKVQFMPADITQVDQLMTAFQPADVVFHCAALSSAWGDYDDFYQINVEGSRHVLHCAKHYNIPRLVYVSSTSVYFDFQDHLNIHEDDVLIQNFANAYAKTKYLSEQLLLAERDKAIEVVIIRPRGIIGEGDQAIMPRIMQIAKKGWFPLFSGGRAMIDVTYVKNVAYALILAAKAKDIDGECINISNDQPIQVKTLLIKIFTQCQYQVRLIPVPYNLFYSIAALLEWFAKIRRRQEPALTKYGIGLMAKSQTLNLDKAKVKLGYRPIFSLDEAISNYAAWQAGNQDSVA